MRGWLTDVLLGGGSGALIGAIVAVNVVIAFGPDSGYESSIADVFEEHVAVGVLVVTLLAAGPLAGIAIARWVRRRSERSAAE